MQARSDDRERRNFLLNLAEGALFLAGGAFISVQTVLPALVTRLGGGNIAVGSVSVAMWMGLFLPQVFAARYVQTLAWKKPWALGFGALQRTAVALIGATLLLAGDAPAALAIFLVLFTLLSVVTGISTPGWYDLFAKLTPVRRRGRLAGLRNALGGAGALLSGYALTMLLTALPFPWSYASAFFAAAVLQGVSLALQFWLVEDRSSPVLPPVPWGVYLRQLREVLGANREFRKFLLASAFPLLAGVPAGFYTVYALRKFGLGESVVGEFTLIMVAGQVAGAVAGGVMADRYGNRIVMILAAGATLCAGVCALAAPSPGFFRAVFAFLGFTLGTELMARYNMCVEYGPVEQRSTYIGLMNTLLAPLYLAGLAGGWVSDAFGYEALFLMGALASSAGLLLFLFRVRDPRVAEVAA